MQQPVMHLSEFTT